MPETNPAIRIDTYLKVTSPYSDLLSDALITNLSTTGAFIQTTDPLPVETVFALNFSLPDDPVSITADASVVWSRSTHSLAPPGMGIQFSSIASGHQDRLAAFIKRNS